MALQALVTDIHSLSAHDGPGMRTTVFFKGCSLRCAWCHNPETIRKEQEITWEAEKCLGCHACEMVCPVKAISFNRESNYIIDRESCIACELCVEVCPAEALKTAGEKYSVEELYERIVKDEPFIKGAGGGVTFSGGEPLLQVDFLKELAKKLKERSFHLALDTCGMVPPEHLQGMLPLTDLVLFDLKEMDSRKHKVFTGAGNERILRNLFVMRDYIRERNLKTEVWIRTPLIPGMTDTEENIYAIGDFLAQEFSGMISRWELLGFNNMCTTKYRKLGISWPLAEEELLPAGQTRYLLEVARKAGKGLKEISFSGLTRREKVVPPRMNG